MPLFPYVFLRTASELSITSCCHWGALMSAYSALFSVNYFGLQRAELPLQWQLVSGVHVCVLK